MFLCIFLQLTNLFLKSVQMCVTMYRYYLYLFTYIYLLFFEVSTILYTLYDLFSYLAEHWLLSMMPCWKILCIQWRLLASASELSLTARNSSRFILTKMNRRTLSTRYFLFLPSLIQYILCLAVWVNAQVYLQIYNSLQVDTFASVYKQLTGRDVTFEFPESYV